MRMPHAVLFDLDDTIISAYSRPTAAWRAVAHEFAHELRPLSLDEAVTAISRSSQTYWSEANRAQARRMDLRRARREIVSGALARIAADGGPPVAGEVAVRMADRFTQYRIDQMRLLPHAHETLDALRARGVRLALITNGDAAGQRAKLARFDLTERFDHIQIEEEAGFGKPDERSYLHALGVFGVDARDACMVGDNLEWEIAAPQRLGLFAIWHDTLNEGLPAESTVRPDRIIKALSELLDVLQ
jgi:putative hydrolase of the HAD superfamily